MEIKKISSIGRPLDFNYKTNKAITIITLITISIGIVISFYNQLEFINIIFQGISFGITFFLCWAISREIDPDNNLSAFLALIPLFIFLLIYMENNLLILFWMLISLRIINRTSGLPATKFDSIILLILSLLLSYYFSWIFGLLVTFVFFADAKLVNGQRFQLITSALSLLLSFVLAVFSNQEFGLILSSYVTSIVLILITIIFLLIILSRKKIRSKGDNTNELLNFSRIQAAQIFAIVSAFAISLFTNYLIAFIPIWCAFFGVILNHFLEIIFHKYNIL